MASAVDSRLAYARLSAVATASRLPTATRGSNNSYTTSWDTTVRVAPKAAAALEFAARHGRLQEHGRGEFGPVEMPIEALPGPVAHDIDPAQGIRHRV